MNGKTSKIFMAFATGRESTEMPEFKLYKGVAPVKIKCVQPDAKGLTEFWGRDIDKEPSYITSKETATGTRKTVRIDFFVETDEKVEINIKNKLTFFLSDSYMANKENTKYKIIDRFGNTAWATVEEIKAKKIPVYQNGPANIDADYRLCHLGEEELTDFIKNYLNIPPAFVVIDGKRVKNPKYAEELCLARLDSIDKYFTGDFSELKDICKLLPNNLINVCFGVRTADDGSQYQCIYSGKTVKYGAKQSSFATIEKHINERKSYGALANEDYDILPLHEYDVNASDIPQTVEQENPWNTTSTEETGLPF